MIFNARSTTFFTIAAALASFVAAAPKPADVALEERGQQVIIGFRTVSPEQAKRYNDAGTITDDGNMIGTQIGAGAYTTPGAGQWPSGPTNWHCVITCDSDALDRVAKAWVPKTYDGTELWFKGDEVVDSYIKKLESSWNPATTLRMSIIDGRGWGDVQMVIPPGLLNSNGGAMSITASCKEKVEDMPTNVVNYDDWHNNIKGNRE